jgi:hypothetical protein
MLARRALHSGNGWLICKVFCKSIRINFLETYISNSDATPWPEANWSGSCPNVFILFTILYQIETLRFPSRIQHKSPVYRQFRKAFS